MVDEYHRRRALTQAHLASLNDKYPSVYTRGQMGLIFEQEAKSLGGKIIRGRTYWHVEIPEVDVVLRFIGTGRKWQQENLSL